VTLLPLLDARLYSFPPLWIGWTLAFETAFYLLVAAALCTRRPVVCLAGLLALAHAAGWVFKPSLPLLQILLNPIMLEFGYGVLGCLLWQRGIARPAAILAAIAGLLLLVGPRLLYPEAIFSPEAIHTIDGSLGLTRALLWGAPWALILVGIVAFDRDESDPGRDPLVMLGNASYSLYLTHAVLMALLEQWGLIPALWPPLIIVAATCAAIALGLATHWAVERPIARWFAQRGRFQATCVTAEARIAHLPA
jgi:peptidoglycan/LPS O-acetylase OafA/YrhL